MTLSDLCGRPARVHVLEAACRDRALARLTGFLSQATEQGLRIHLSDPFRPAWNEAILVVEVMTGSALVRLETTARPVDRAVYQIETQVPASVTGGQRRRHPRVDVQEQPVRFGRGLMGPYETGRMLNISAGGCAFEAEGSTQTGEYLVLQFDTPDGVRFAELRSRVVRVKERDDRWLVAVAFTDLHPAVQAALNLYVTSIGAGTSTTGWGKVYRL